MTAIQRAKFVVLKRLSSLGAYVGNEAVTTDSIYIKLKSNQLGSITIRDHNTIEKYKYKWNLRDDIAVNYTETKNGIVRHYYPLFMAHDMCDEILRLDKEKKEIGSVVCDW